MSRLEFLHAADLHLDTQFRGIGNTAPEIGAALRDASMQAFRNLIDVAVQRDVAFVVIAGDLYDGDDRGLRAQLPFKHGMERLNSAGIPCFIVHGNHDPIGHGWSAIENFPPNVHIFGASEVESVPVKRNGKVVATVHGISFDSRMVTENLAARFAKPTGGGLNVGLLHANVGGDPNHGNYSPCKLEDLQTSGMNYWALGHVHQRTVWKGADCTVAYSGNTQGRSPKPSELGEKGVLVVPFQGSHVGEPEFVATDVVRFIEVGLDVSEITSVAEATSQLERRITEQQRLNAGRSLIVRAVISGRSAIHMDLQRSEVAVDLCSHVRETFASDDPFVWVDAIADRTALPRDPAELRARGDFVAEVLMSLDGLQESMLNREIISEIKSDLPVSVVKAIESVDVDLASLEDQDGERQTVELLTASMLASQALRIESKICDVLVDQS